jgi:hypothetical protein
LVGIEIYYRHKSYYIQIIGSDGIIGINRANRIPVHIAINFPTDQLKRLVEVFEPVDFIDKYIYIINVDNIFY